jgi:hypothetical protein
LPATGRGKFVRSDGIPREILKLSGEATIPYLVGLLNITINNNAILGDWKKAIVVSIYKEGDRSVVGNYRPVTSTSVVCKQLEQVIPGNLRQVKEMSKWLYKVSMGLDQGTHVKVK